MMASKETVSSPVLADKLPNTQDDPDTVMDEYRLYDYEEFWASLQPWLKQKGYMLRPRYQAGWKASWFGGKQGAWAFCEDGQVFPEAKTLMDAVRIKDGEQVILKKLVSERGQAPSGSHEAKMALTLSSQSYLNDPRNHCIPIHEVLRVPDDRHKEKHAVVELLVMPFLTRWNQPFFKTIGECVDFFQQTIEGLEFMHSKSIAHNDIKSDSIMMDSRPLYASLVHPARPEMRRDWSGPSVPHTRTERPVKYLYIDFGLADKYPALCPGRLSWYGGDRSVPEFVRQEVTCDPFAVDVYCLGNLFRENIIQGSEFHTGYRGFEFMEALVKDMTHHNPGKRPRISEVKQRFEEICRTLGHWKLHSRMIRYDESLPCRIWNWFSHWTKQVIFMCKGLPPVPSPSLLQGV